LARERKREWGGEEQRNEGMNGEVFLLEGNKIEPTGCYDDIGHLASY
jgi:hypothetical protein